MTVAGKGGRPRKTQKVVRLKRGVGRPENTDGHRICKWIEQYLFVPEGEFVGQRVRLSDWQEREIRRIYDNPHGTRRAILSMGRKNAKTTMAAMLLLVHLCGPKAEDRPNSQLYSAAQSRDQAAVLFALAAKMIRMNRDLADAVTIKESTKELFCDDLGIRYRALSAETTTAFGLSPSFIVHDELGQVRGPRSTLYEALETATGAQKDPLSIIISTQAPTDADLLSVLIDDAMAGHDPQTVVSLYTAPLEDDPFAEATIKLANPALGTFLSRSEVLTMARTAQRMPAREAEYRNLILNQRVEISNPFVSPSVWKSCNGPVDIGALQGVPIYAGLDLSEVRDLTALVLIGNIEGKWHVLPTFWLPAEGLADKAVTDHVPYDLWASQGFLATTPGKTISYEYVSTHLRTLFSQFNIRKLGFDRWNMKHLKPWLFKAGFSEELVTERFVEFGQGMFSMSPALRDLEQMLLSGTMVHGDHPILSMCVANTIIVLDDAGNRKPSKKRSVGRIDGLVALAMAVGVAPLEPQVIDIGALLG